MIPENEYAPFYKNYIQQVEKTGKSIVESLEIAQKEFENTLASIATEKQHFAYAPEKWTVKEVVQHVIDTERVFAYRALRFARNDKTALPGFDQDLFVTNVDANSRDWTDLLTEMTIVRQGTILLFKSFSDEALLRIGEGSGKNMSVRALGYISTGHQLHHLSIIKERYLKE